MRTTRGWKPASEPTVRTASSSAVLREFTIQSWSRNRSNTASESPRTRLDRAGTPRLQAVDHSGTVTSEAPNERGARL